MSKKVKDETPVTIPKWQYDELLWSEAVLEHLYAEGVDNWERYSVPDREEWELEWQK